MNDLIYQLPLDQEMLELVEDAVHKAYLKLLWTVPKTAAAEHQMEVAVKVQGQIQKLQKEKEGSDREVTA